MPISRITTVGARHGRVSYVANYAVDVWHDQLNRRRTITGPIEPLIRLQAESLLAQWEAEWQAKQKADAQSAQEAADEAEATEAIQSEFRARDAADLHHRLRTLLADALAAERPTGWEQFRSTAPYPIPKPDAPPVPSRAAIGARQRVLPPEPLAKASAYVPQLTLLDRLIPQRRAKKESECEARFIRDHKRWKAECARIREMNAEDQRRYETLLATTRKQYEADVMVWEEERRAYEAEQFKNNLLVEKRQREYRDGEPAAIAAYCDLMLNTSPYPAEIGPSWRTEYEAPSRTLHVECTLPSPGTIPTLYEVSAAADGDGIVEKHLTAEQARELEESVNYQICLRSLYELFKADALRAIDRIVFTAEIAGEGDDVEDADGGTVIPWVSLDVSRDEFLALPLREDDPRTLVETLQSADESYSEFVPGVEKSLPVYG
jgi:restriction system protein